MKVELHTQKSVIKDGKLERIQDKFIADLDMSLASEMRYEAKFPELADKEDLYSYSKRISEIEDTTAPVIVSKMKMLYCWFETEISFIEFLKLFDLSDIEYVKRLTKEMQDIFTIILQGSAEKN